MQYAARYLQCQVLSFARIQSLWDTYVDFTRSCLTIFYMDIFRHKGVYRAMSTDQILRLVVDLTYGCNPVYRLKRKLE